MLQISKRVFISENEIEFRAIRSQGPGGQHVNKVTTAVQLRFDIAQSSLPALYKQRLMIQKDRRITKEGVIVIKVQQGRSQKKNKCIRAKAMGDFRDNTTVGRQIFSGKNNPGNNRRQSDRNFSNAEK